MLKIGKINTKYFLAKTMVVSLLAFLALAGNALAGNVVTNISGGEKIFDSDNIYPGYTESHTVTIQNTSPDPGETVDIYFNFKVTDGSTLADQLRLYVIRNGGSYRIGGARDRMSLQEADDQGSLYVDRLTAGRDEDYEIKIRFDKDAGNAFQNLETKFDIDFNITSQTASGPEPLRAGFTGQAPPEEVAGAETTSEEAITGEETLGAETSCSEWPLWVWILLLVVYTALFNYSSFRQGLENKIHWFFPAFWTAAIFALWYFFEKCRLYPWYPYAIVVIALVSYFSYLYWFREKRLEPDFKDKEEL